MSNENKKNTYTVSLSPETIDSIMQQVLVDDYVGLLKSINDLQNKPHLEKFEQDDLADDLKYRQAFEILLSYYLPQRKYNELMDKKSADV